MRKRNIFLSAVMGLTEEFVAIISGFILPRMILSYFGSDYNGIISSVTQFIGCISLLKSGIGMATKAALYKPLYEKNQEKINGIMSATMKFLRKVAVIFLIGIFVFAAIYPFFITDDFPWGFTFLLVLIVSIGTFFQYYFGLGNQLLLEADQKYYIVALVTTVNTLFNTIISVICIKLGMQILLVKFFSSIVYCSTPILLNYYVSKVYHLDTRVRPDWDSISKRWEAFGMQIANFINNNTDIIIASIFLNMKEVSVYTIYYLPINGIKKITTRITTGFEGALGNIVATDDSKLLKDNYLFFEFTLNLLCVIMFSCLMILIVPFISVYTSGITDANYYRESFAFIACLAELFYCLRLSYTYMIQATGSFSETKKYYYIEAIINITLSVFLVNTFGLVGIVLGTMVAMVYTTVTFAYFVYNHIIKVNICVSWKRMIITLGNILLNYIVGVQLCNCFIVDNYLAFFYLAIFVGITVVIISCLINYICYRTLTKKIFYLILKKRFK